MFTYEAMKEATSPGSCERMLMILFSNRLKDLMLLLKSSPFVDMRSIIVYCKFQVDFFPPCFLKIVHTFVQYLNPLDTILLQKYNIFLS